MNQLLKSTIAVCTTTLTICSTVMSAEAGQWSGRGQIIDGYDKGASVYLKIRVEGNRATILSNPSNGERVTLNTPNQRTSAGFWEIRPCSPNLCAVLKQLQPRQRTIYYRLSPE